MRVVGRCTSRAVEPDVGFSGCDAGCSTGCSTDCPTGCSTGGEAIWGLGVSERGKCDCQAGGRLKVRPGDTYVYLE